MINLYSLLQEAKKHNASDIHIRDSSIYFRINKRMFPLPIDKDNIAAITNNLIKEICKHLDIESNIIKNAEISKTIKLDSMRCENIRCRISAFWQNGACFAIRLFKDNIPTLKELLAPIALENLSLQNSGLVLVCGATSSGKSTTIAAMIEHINSNAKKHILTIEDPIEYIHSNKDSYITQREIGRDSKDFHTALESSLRQDPDVIVIGEILDSNILKLAINHSLSGHLVLSTFHANNATHAISRILGLCQNDTAIYTNLSDCLQGIVTQKLYEKDNALMADYEVLVTNHAVKTLIKENKLNQIESQISMGRELGMRHFTHK